MIAQERTDCNRQAEIRTADGQALGNIVKSASTERRSKRYILQEYIAELLRDSRISRCMHRRIGPKVSVKYSVQHQHAHYGGLATCGDVWRCPICSAKISARRRAELDKAALHYGGSIFMLSFTISHHAGERLGDVKSALNAAYKQTFSGRYYQEIKRRYKIAGSITAQEVTYGDNGWHAHKHTLLLSEITLSKSDLYEIEAALSLKYRMALDKLGAFASQDNALKVIDGGDAAVRRYLSKLGLSFEVTMTETKSSGITPFQLAQMAADGDPEAARLFKEYADAYRGSRQLVYSKGLKAKLGMQDKSDQEIAAEDEPAHTMLTLDAASWQKVCSKGLRAELLNVADSGDIEELTGWMRSRGLEYEIPESEAEIPKIKHKT